MATTTAVCNSYKLEIPQGIHGPTDGYKIALYTSAAVLDATTTVYSATNEVVGVNYVAGGKFLLKAAGGYGADYALTAGVASLGWANVTWASLGTSVAPVIARAALIYNSTMSNRAVAVFDFGADKTANGIDLTIQIPGSGIGVVRIS